MKILLCSILGLVALTVGGLAQVAVPQGAVKLGKPQPSGIKSPEYQIQSGPQKRYKIGTWLEIEVPYETLMDDISELTFEFVVGIGVGQNAKLLDGNVTYINIPKGRDHYAVMYIPPRTLDKLTGGKTLTQADIANVWVTVKSQGATIDLTALKPENIPTNLPHLSGLILNKNQTPFAPLYYDRYETIKEQH
jgi:hypothetical protein